MAAGDSAAPGASCAAHAREEALVSFHDLYEHLERARQTRAPDELQRVLTDRLAQLRDCGDMRKPRSPASREALAKSKEVHWHGKALAVDGVQRDLSLAISDRLDMDEVESLAMLRTFLDSEHRSLGALERTLISSSEGFDDFLDAFYVFFFEEQLAVIRCVSALLRIAEDAHNELYDMATTVLDQFADASLAKRCLEWFEAEALRALPASVAGDPHYAMLWARQGLERQLALLEVAFLLYYGRLPPSAAFTADVLECAHRMHFGQRQANATIFDADAHAKCECVRDLLVFLAVECLNLEAALDTVPDGASAPEDAALAPFSADVEAMERCIAQLEMAASNTAYAPLLLSFALLFRRLDEVGAQTALEPRLAAAVDVLDSGPPIWRRLVQGAFDASMDLFGVLRTLVTSPLLGAGTRALGASNLSALAYRAVFKGLLLTITEMVQPEYLPDMDVLVDLWCAAFRTVPGDALDGIAALCTQFWTQDIQYTTRASLFDTARRRFPASFRPLVRLAQALSGTAPGAPSPETATAVVEMLAQLPSVALVLSKHAPGLAPWETVDDFEAPALTYELRTRITVPCTRVTLPRGTRGILVSPPGEAPAIVMWQPDVPISAWHVMHDVLVASVMPSSDAGEAGGGALGAREVPALLSPDWADDGGAVVAVEVAELFVDVLEAEAALGEAVLAHLGERGSLVPAALALVQGGLAAHPLDTRRVHAGYRLLMALLPLRRNEIWQHVRSTNVLVGSAGRVPLMDAGTPVSALLTHERNTGKFTCTLCLLDLLHALLEQVQSTQFVDPPRLVQVQAAVLARAFAWVASCIWNEHQSWAYADQFSWMQLKLKCMRLFSAVLDDPCLHSVDKTEAADAPVDAVQPLVSVVERVLGAQASPVTLAPMLVALGMGYGRIDAMYRAGDAHTAHLLEELVETCLVTSSVLVTRSTSSHMLATLFVGAAPDARGTLASVILSYIAAPVPSSLAMAAAHLVTDIVRARDVTALRLAGHLGSTDQVESAVSQLLGVLENTYADVALRMALWRMFAAFVLCQPALATLLLTGAHLAHDHAPNKSEVAMSTTALELAVDALGHVDALWDTHPELLEAILCFLNEAWAHARAHPGVFGKLRREPALWDRLDALVRRPVPAPPGGASVLEPDEERSSTAYAFQLVCQARGLRLLQSDLHVVRAPRTPSDEAGCVRIMRALCDDTDALVHTLCDAMQTMPVSVPRATERDVRAAVPDMPWALLRHGSQRDEYDRQRTLGPAYMYHVAAVAAHTPAAVSVSEVVDMASMVSVRWSVVDAQARRARAWTDCMGVMTAHLLAHAESQGAAKYEALQRSLSRAAVVMGPLAFEEDRAHVVALLAVLVGASQAKLDAELLGELGELVAELGEYAAYKLSSLGAAGRGTRTPLLQLMLAVVTAARRGGVSVPAMPRIVAHAMEALMQLESLAPLLTAPLGEDARVAESDLDVLVAVVQACMAPETHVRAAAWLGPMRETRILPAAAELVARAPLVPASESVGAPRTHVRFLMPLLRLVDALAVHRDACELVAHAGMVRALSATALSALAEQGALDAVLPSGDPHPLHAAWLLILRVVVRLIENLDAEARAHLVDTEVHTFVCLSAAQIERSLSFAPLTQTAPLDVGQLLEVCIVLRLFHAMWEAKSRCAQARAASPAERVRIMPLGASFWRDTPLLLQQLAYLSGHADEVRQMLLGTDGKDETGAHAEHIVRVARRAVDDALEMLLALVWDVSGAGVVLTAPAAEWPRLPAMIQPSMHVAPHAPASFGTLLELASTLTSKAKAGSESARGALEQCMGVCATQAIVWAQGPLPARVSEHVRGCVDQAQAELDAGLGRDIDAAIQSASSAVQSAWWDVLRAFQARFMCSAGE